MAAVLVGLAILTILVLIALKIGLSKEDAHINPARERIIRVSGAYSIVRESPRAGLAALRPKEDEIRQYLAGINEDINGARLTDSDRAALLKHWNTQMEANLQAIEKGDRDGATFYYYDFPNVCPVCKPFITKGNFVTREEIYNHPEIIPPFHTGCACVLAAHRGMENLRETTISGMVPFFESGAPPRLPDWTSVAPLSATTGVST
jgi:hypothetical protein